MNMKRNAFTLVELLVVVSIIALLVAILMPSLSKAKSVAKAAKCAHNLSQLGTGFVASAGQSPEGSARPLYPKKRKWPSIPYDVLSVKGIYQCPEDIERKPAGIVPDLVYCLSASAYGDVRIPFEDGHNCKARTGEDDRGPYIEFVFEESLDTEVQWCPNGASEYPECNHHDDKDGVFRFYTNNDGSLSMTLLNYHDNDLTYITLSGERLWPESEGERLHDYVGKWVDFSVLNSSYAINSAVGEQRDVAPDTVVLVDYDERIADMDFPDEINQHLSRKEVARHLGRVNVLFADQSVQRMGITALNPKIHPDMWLP